MHASSRDVHLNAGHSRFAESGIRPLLLVVVLLGLAGTTGELLLIGHFEGALQTIPLVLLALAWGAVLWFAMARRGAALRALQVSMLLLVVGGVAGAVLHVQASAEFQREMDPALRGAALWSRALRVQSPPALAPGAMVQTGLVGIAFAFRHPRLAGHGRAGNSRAASESEP